MKPVPNPIVDGESVVVYNGEAVVMPLWYWKQIVEYIIEVEETIVK